MFAVYLRQQQVAEALCFPAVIRPSVNTYSISQDAISLYFMEGFQ